MCCFGSRKPQGQPNRSVPRTAYGRQAGRPRYYHDIDTGMNLQESSTWASRETRNTMRAEQQRKRGLYPNEPWRYDTRTPHHDASGSSQHRDAEKSKTKADSSPAAQITALPRVYKPQNAAYQNTTTTRTIPRRDPFQRKPLPQTRPPTVTVGREPTRTGMPSSSYRGTPTTGRVLGKHQGYKVVGEEDAARNQQQGLRGHGIESQAASPVGFDPQQLQQPSAALDVGAVRPRPPRSEKLPVDLDNLEYPSSESEDEDDDYEGGGTNVMALGQRQRNECVSPLEPPQQPDHHHHPGHRPSAFPGKVYPG